MNLSKKFLPHILICVLVVMAAPGCNKEPEYIPGMSIQGIRAPISKVLFSPIAYDSAVLAIEGYIKDVNIENPENEQTALTTFKILDLKGNYINISMNGTWDLENDDYLIVGGIYRKNGNVLEADKFEVIELLEEDEDERKINEWD